MKKYAREDGKMKTETEVEVIEETTEGKTSGGFGKLTQTQREALQKVARLSPGYKFRVVGYAVDEDEKATVKDLHVFVLSPANTDPVALVAWDHLQTYDKQRSTYKTAQRVGYRVFHKSYNLRAEDEAALI